MLFEKWAIFQKTLMLKQTERTKKKKYIHIYIYICIYIENWTRQRKIWRRPKKINEVNVNLQIFIDYLITWRRNAWQCNLFDNRNDFKVPLFASATKGTKLEEINVRTHDCFHFFFFLGGIYIKHIKIILTQNYSNPVDSGHQPTIAATTNAHHPKLP